MSAGEVKVPIYCPNERTVVGHLSAPEAEPCTITPEIAAAWFVPADARYQLRAAELRRGEYLRCPRCRSILEVRGELATPDPEAALGSLAAKVRCNGSLSVTTMKQAAVSIILGTTAVEARP